MMNVKERLLGFIENLDFDKGFVLDLLSQTEYCYEEFFSQCKKIAEWLEEDDTTNNVIAIMENSYELMKLYFAVMMTNKKLYVVDPQKSLQEQGEILEEIDNGALLQDKPDNHVEFVKFAERTQEFKGVCEKAASICPNIKGILLEALTKRDFHALYLITFTSGTTGQAKGVQNSLNNLFYTAYAFLDKVQTPKNKRFLHVMPMTYMAGILNSIIFPFVAENQIVLSKRFSVTVAIKYWEIVDKYRISVFWLAPAMLMMIEQVDVKGKGVSICQKQPMYYYIGTSALTSKTRQAFEEKYGVTLYASYGLSETLFISVETDKSKKQCKNNVGELLQGVKYVINGDGELLLSVPWMFLGYSNTDTKEYFDNKFYKTGDLVEVVDDILVIKGRKKDLIIRGGMNLSPVKIEDVVMSVEGIKECVIFAGLENHGEEQICCGYVLKEEDESEHSIEKQVAQTVMEKLGKNYRIDKFIRLDVLPRNINGKIDKQQLIKRVENSL